MIPSFVRETPDVSQSYRRTGSRQYGTYLTTKTYSIHFLHKTFNLID